MLSVILHFQPKEDSLETILYCNGGARAWKDTRKLVRSLGFLESMVWIAVRLGAFVIKRLRVYFYCQGQKLMDKFKSVIPSGCSKTKIRATRRDSHRPREETLGSTLGEEATGYVTVDPEGRAMRYDEMNVMSQIAAAPASTVDMWVKEDGQKKWKRVGRVDTEEDQDLDDRWKHDLHHGTDHIKNSFVKQSDPHFDARVFIAKHPHGTGSCFAEAQTGKPQKYVSARLLSMEKWFRSNAQWCFFQLDRYIKSKLFFHKRYKARATGQPEPKPKTADIYETLYGTVQPATLPESAAPSSKNTPLP